MSRQGQHGVCTNIISSQELWDEFVDFEQRDVFPDAGPGSVAELFPFISKMLSY